MTDRLKLLCCASGLALAAAPAFAQEGAWQFEGTFYLFAAETTTGIGNAETTLSFSDALDNLDMAAMAAFYASNGQWTFVADYMLTDISFESRTPGDLFSGAQTSVKTQVLSAGALYNVYSQGLTSVDLGGGFRWFDTKTTLKLRPGTLPAQSRSQNDDWIDPVIAARARVELAPKWTGTAMLDWGGFVDDRETWQVTLTANYALSEDWVLRFGYRYLSVENDEDDRDYSFEQSGPVVGISYRF